MLEQPVKQSIKQRRFFLCVKTKFTSQLNDFAELICYLTLQELSESNAKKSLHTQNSFFLFFV